MSVEEIKKGLAMRKYIGTLCNAPRIPLDFTPYNPDDDIEFLLAENQRLVNALEYFTNEDIYKIRENDDDPFDINPEIVLIDGLQIANDAIQAYKLLEKKD